MLPTQDNGKLGLGTDEAAAPYPVDLSPPSRFCRRKHTKGPFSPRFPFSHWGNSVTSRLSRAKEPVRFCPREVIGAILSYSVGQPLKTAFSRSAENLARFLGRAPETGRSGYWGGVWALSFFCVSSLCFIILCNLNDPRFHCNRFRTTRDAAVSTFPFLPNREEAVLIAGEVGGKGRTRGVGGWKNGPASPGLELGGELALDVEALS